MQTILIIDDDAAIGNLEQEVLERAGYAVLRTYSGTEALLLLKDSRPDLVLLDLMLPGLSGEEVLPQLQGISVIVVSAKTAVPGQGRTAAGKIRPARPHRRGHAGLHGRLAQDPHQQSARQAAGRDWQRPY